MKLRSKCLGLGSQGSERRFWKCWTDQGGGLKVKREGCKGGYREGIGRDREGAESVLSICNL